MKNYQALKILFLLLLMVSSTTQTTKATTVDDPPVYINGGDGLLRDLYCNLSSALPSQSDCIKGKCFFTFIISKEGTIDVETIKLARKTTLPDEYVNAAKEAIKHLGKFKPGGRYNSKEEKWEPLRVQCNIGVISPIPSKYLTSE